MKKGSSMLSKINAESPKTPGGISKSLLTPCRRLGLSRNWKKGGSSPFVSPLANEKNITEPEVQESVTRKRKQCASEMDVCVDNEKEISTPSYQNVQTTQDSDTPKRTVLQRKKSKTLILAKENNDEETDTVIKKSCDDKSIIDYKPPIENSSILFQNSSKNEAHNNDSPVKEFHNFENINNDEPGNDLVSSEPKQTSPNNLTKECIVVIQNNTLKPTCNPEEILNFEKKTNSQVFIDSDSDDVPLSVINAESKNKNSLLALQKDSMHTTDKEEVQTNKQENKKKTTGNLGTVTKTKTKLSRNLNKEVKNKSESLSQGSNSFDDEDDDDFIFNTKRTILIKKTYDKVVKPVKAKSTGSITNRDLEEIKARIEAKKKLLLVKAITPETEDIRGLIKKWQKGCQDALMDLMMLMKKRMPEQNMENSELLQMLKIPPDLVGYDSENDCFNTPDDEQIVLNSLNIS